MKKIMDKLGKIMVEACERDGNYELAERLEKYIEKNKMRRERDENPEKYIMPVKKVSKKEAARIYPKRPKRLRGICLNWPGEMKKK